MGKLVVFDIDGTLVDYERNIPDSTIEGIHKLRENGHIPVIATGRVPAFLEKIRAQLEIESFIGMNGQIASINGEVVYTNPIDTDNIEALINTSHGFGSQTILVTIDKFIGSDFETPQNDPTIFKNFANGFANADTSALEMDTLLPIERVRYESQEVLTAYITASEEDDPKYREALPQLHFTRAGSVISEVLNLGSNKYVGVQALANHYNIENDNIVTFGDALNDLEMIANAGTGVAMGNARDEIKGVADFVTDDVANDGIWNALNKLELIN